MTVFLSNKCLIFEILRTISNPRSWHPVLSYTSPSKICFPPLYVFIFTFLLWRLMNVILQWKYLLLFCASRVEPFWTYDSSSVGHLFLSYVILLLLVISCSWRTKISRWQRKRTGHRGSELRDSWRFEGWKKPWVLYRWLHFSFWT